METPSNASSAAARQLEGVDEGVVEEARSLHRDLGGTLDFETNRMRC